MSLLIATPMFGMQCHSKYFESCIELKEDLTNAGMEHDWLITTNESLITRARNTSVATFRGTGYQKLLFVDGDIEFSSEDVALLWNLNVPVACGAYRIKQPDSPLGIWRDGKLEPLESEAPVAVDYAGTGFMMIDRSVFDQLEKAHPEWRYEEGMVGWSVAFFQDVIEDGIHLSEDYFFCKRWREHGGDVIVHPGCELTHWGQVGFENCETRRVVRPAEVSMA